MTTVSDDFEGRSGPCASCGNTITITRFGDPYAGGPAPPEDIGQDPGMRLLLPVGRSPWAIAAGYFGLFSVLCLPAPIAIILALVAIRDIKRNPQKHGMGRAIFGLIMGTVGTGFLVFALIGALVNA
jgi:hypothetical protein